jgi:hypothetical protein
VDLEDKVAKEVRLKTLFLKQKHKLTKFKAMVELKGQVEMDFFLICKTLDSHGLITLML